MGAAEGYQNPNVNYIHMRNYYINFNPIQYPNSFFFSLDKLKIYNSNNSQYNIFENPSFIIKYDNSKRIFSGTEIKNQNIGEIIQNLQNQLYKVQNEMKEIKSKQETRPVIQKVEKHITVQHNNIYNQQLTENKNIYPIHVKQNDRTIIDHSFVLSNQQQFENNYLEIYEIKI